MTTTRAGGVSAAPFDTFNLGDHVGDDPAAVAPTVGGWPRRIGLGSDGIVWMNQVHGDRVSRWSTAAGDTVDKTDALVTTTPTIGFGRGDRRLRSRFDGRRARRGGRGGPCRPGRAQQGVVAGPSRRWSGWARTSSDISVLLGPAVSGRNYEVPEEMAAEVEAALPGSRTTTRQAPRTGPAGRNRCAINGLWGSPPSTSIRAARWRTATCSAIVATPRPGGWRPWCGWNDTTVTSARELELSDALAACANDWPAPPRPPGATSTKLNCCPSRNSFRQPMW